MKKFNVSNVGTKLATLAFLASAGLAQAADMVPPAEIAQSKTDAGILGLAVLGVIVSIKAFHWIRRAL